MWRFFCTASITCLRPKILCRAQDTPNQLLLHISGACIHHLQHGRKHRACHALGLGAEKEEEEDAGYVPGNCGSLTKGYAKRWLIIFEDGTLSYSLKPESESRGIIEVPHASVSSDIRHGTLLN